MMNYFEKEVEVAGTLAANHIFAVPVGVPCQLVKVLAVNTTANAGTLKVGTLANDDAYLESCNFGVSSVAVSKGRTDFVGDQFPTIAADGIIYVTITDHASHMAGPVVTLGLTVG